jgi:NAD(P)H-nitrite reductase large subunit
MTAENNDLDDEVMCTCSGTTRGKIKKLFNDGMDMNDISNWSGALSGCGGCEWDVEQFLKELSEKQKRIKIT